MYVLFPPTHFVNIYLVLVKFRLKILLNFSHQFLTINHYFLPCLKGTKMSRTFKEKNINILIT